MIGFANFMATGEVIPTGLIIMWHGLLANIPTGWDLCDGTNGTPDLRNSFIRGAANAANPGTTGGSATHTHDSHAAQTHSGTAATDHPALTHSGGAVGNHTQLTDAFTSSPTISTLSSNTHSVTQASQHAARAHSVTQPSQHGAESHSSSSSEPAYYTVAFLRKS